MAEKAKRIPNAYDICPKHKGFFISCGCRWDKKTKEEKSEFEEVKENKE